ncbi:M81 family metallopeptidase [Falsiroseomonas sp. HW251]|uniref:M81 family metallopeptidase n=1 Tax=Falsiroseomonas sp. HW251 TaxID=3390998 RepID=UPI003D313F78
MKVALAGFFHETNTFSPIPADLASFLRPGTLPGLTRGNDMAPVLGGLNVPIAGAMQALSAARHELHPVAWASAVPCGPVTRDAFETIAGLILDGIAKVPSLDGVYLDLHGAMVAEDDLDPELTLLRRLRARLGPDVPVVASLDLHANLSPERVAALDGLATFRTYPHLDMDVTGARAAALLMRCMAGERFHSAFRSLPFLIPLHAQGTTTGPAARLFEACEALGRHQGIAGAELALGFPPADVPYAGPAIVVLAGVAADAERAADDIARWLLQAEHEFDAALPGPEAAIREAIAAARHAAGRPVVVADTQDNPGAGGMGDTVGLLRELIALDAPDAVFALLHDPAAVSQAHAIGAGAAAPFRLGAHAATVPGEAPVEASFTVARLADGRITAVGPMYRGIRWDVGATALLRHRGVRVLVSERRLQAADTAILRHAGIDPRQVAIVVLKSTVHFRAEYEAMAARIIVAAAPGLNLADLRGYAYRRLRPGVRPIDPGRRVDDGRA